ncbi:vacuolar protein sorting-associated protein 8 homolog isoform X1 [Conger conger]|uniref:vacuolar protein sorting-associated protein 8 homolog isoform X1 n=1 Tax=Conger conger TaxID=82655 RepID=UPI002A59D776|nr:vacuolar protein sorting-associated protein 8 homolog isoform X1 [Conger conger]
MSENEGEDVHSSELFLGISLPETEELDDQEFDIPQVETAPTLESILNEDSFMEMESNPFLPDDFALSTLEAGELGGGDLQPQQEEVEVSEVEVETTCAPEYQWIKDPPLPAVEQDGVLHCLTLKGVSAQVLSAVGRVEGGGPTAMAVCGIIAIGTSTGQLLIFDPSQVLKLCLGSQALGAQHGSITALSFNRDGTRILCGFSMGPILQWDVESGKLLRTITIVPAGTAVITVKFTDDPTVAVCNDSSGSVFELQFKRSLGAKAWDSRCLFNSEKGAVRCVEPLQLSEELSGHPAAQLLLLAMVSQRKLLVVCQRPEARVIHASPLVKVHGDCVPSLSWHFLRIGGSADPAVAFCQGSCLCLYHVKFGSESISVEKLKEFNFQFEIINTKWLRPRTLLLVDAAEQIHAVDRDSGEQLQELELESMALVSTSAPYPTNQASEENTTAKPREYKKLTYQSVCAHGGQVTLLGTKSVQRVTLKTWEERLDCLVELGRYMEALALAWKFFDRSAKAVVGLPGDIQMRKEKVANKMTKLLLAYVELSLRRCPEQGKLQVMEEHFQKTIPLCVTCCIKFNKTEVLFGEVYEKLIHHSVALGVLFECLQPHISAGRVTSIPPLVMKDMVGHYEDQGMTKLLDDLIPHLNVMTLDLHQVVSLSRQYRLCDVLIFVYNKGMNDYITPIEELLGSMASASHEVKPDELMTVGNKILVYISCCLTGQAYPFGVIPDNMVQTVKSEVFTCLTSMQVKGFEASEEPYPFIRTLLQYNTREFLNVLALAFADLEQDQQAIEFHQRMIDILLQVMLESTDFSPSQIGSLFTFLARQLAKAEDKLFVNRQLFHQALDFLCNPEDTTQHAERQQALLELLQAGGAAYFEENKLLAMAEAVHFFQVCEFVYEQRRLYHRIVTCYLKDPARKGQALRYLHDVISSDELTEDERVLFQNEVFCNLQELLELGARQTATLVLRYFQDSIPLIMETLQQDAKLLFEFLHGVFNPKVEPWPFKDASLLDHDCHERYLELLCQSHPSWALEFLKLSDLYRPEEAVEITQRHKVHDALAYLLESQGNTQGAFSVHMENLKSSLQSAAPSASLEEPGGICESPELLQTVRLLLRDLVAFCQRASVTLDSKQREDLWFPLLDFLMSPSEQLQGPVSPEMERGIKDLTKEVLDGMTSYIPLMAILQRLMQDPVYSVGKYGEIKNLIFGILDAYIYEKTLLEATSNLLSQDLHWSLCSLRAAVTRGLAPVQKRCGVCSQQYTRATSHGDRVVLFSCGHIYHHACLESSLSQQESQAEEWACFKCHAPNKKWTPITPKRVSQDPQCLELDPGQIAASDCLRRVFKNQSRISILMDLIRQPCSSMDSSKPGSIFRHTGILESADLKLNLAPPPLID